MICCFTFFFQAEDGIRDIGVTGVQTCALPIYVVSSVEVEASKPTTIPSPNNSKRAAPKSTPESAALAAAAAPREPPRSEERRVGKECRSRWSPQHSKETKERAMDRRTGIRRQC